MTTTATNLSKCSAALLLAAAVLLVLSPAARAADCLSWSEARGVIARNKLVSPAQARKQAMGKGNEVISMKLCRQGSGYAYRLTVIGAGKKARDIVVEAGGSSAGNGGSGGGGNAATVAEKYVRKYTGSSALGGFVRDRVQNYLRRYGR